MDYGYDYGYDYYSGLGVALLIAGGVVLFCCLLMIIAYWKIFSKAGKPGWHALIPFLSTYDIYEVAWSRTMGWVALGLSIGVGVFGGVMSATNNSAMSDLFDILGLALSVIGLVQLYFLSESFGHEVPFFIGLLFLTPIFLLILAFDGSRYLGSYEMRKNYPQYPANQQYMGYPQTPPYPQQYPYQQYPGEQPKAPYPQYPDNQQYTGYQQNPYGQQTPPQNNPFENGGNFQ